MKEKIELGFGGVDSSEYPIVYMDLGDREPSVPEVDELFDAAAKVYANTEGRFVVIADASRSGWLSAEPRIQTGKRSQELQVQYQDRFICSFVVVNNMLVRTMLKGVNLAKKPVVPRNVVSSVEEAYEKAREVLRDEGLIE